MRGQRCDRTGHDQGAQHALLRSKVVDWFPLLPRTRPPGQALHLRIDEIRGLACAASQGPDEIRISSAAEALNKAALVELSGLRRATMPTNLLDDLMTSAKTSEAQLAQVLARDTHHPSTA